MNWRSTTRWGQTIAPWKVLGEPTLKMIAPGVGCYGEEATSRSIGRYATMSARSFVWWSSEFCKKYGYPPDMQDKATQTVLEQAEVLSEGWAV